VTTEKTNPTNVNTLKDTKAAVSNPEIKRATATKETKKTGRKTAAKDGGKKRLSHNQELDHCSLEED
jgi:hypothetical protein